MSSLAAAHAPAQIVRDLIADELVARACHFFTERAAEITEEHAAICAIPAPPFGEAPLDTEGRSRVVAAGNEQLCSRLATALTA